MESRGAAWLRAGDAGAARARNAGGLPQRVGLLEVGDDGATGGWAFDAQVAKGVLGVGVKKLGEVILERPLLLLPIKCAGCLRRLRL